MGYTISHLIEGSKGQCCALNVHHFHSFCSNWSAAVTLLKIEGLGYKGCLKNHIIMVGVDSSFHMLVHLLFLGFYLCAFVV